MVFSSNVFLFYYLPIVLFVYFLINSKFRNIWLFLASLFFYAWGEPYYVVVMLISIIVNFILGGYFLFHRSKNSQDNDNACSSLQFGYSLLF